jgi:hypothetical protein
MTCNGNWFGGGVRVYAFPGWNILGVPIYVATIDDLPFHCRFCTTGGQPVRILVSAMTRFCSW